MLTSLFFPKTNALKNLERIRTDPIFSGDIRAKAGELIGQLKNRSADPESALVTGFLESCRVRAEDDIFRTPIARLQWVTEGKWSPTAASYAPTWTTEYVSPFVAGCVGAISDRDAARLLMLLRE